MAAIPVRWRVTSAKSLISVIEETITRLNGIRYITPGGLTRFVGPNMDAEAPRSRKKTKDKVDYIRLRRREVNHMPVLSRAEKHKILVSEFSTVNRALQQLSTSDFFARLPRLSAMLTELAREWGGLVIPDESMTGSDADWVEDGGDFGFNVNSTLDDADGDVVGVDEGDDVDGELSDIDRSDGDVDASDADVDAADDDADPDHSYVDRTLTLEDDDVDEEEDDLTKHTQPDATTKHNTNESHFQDDLASNIVDAPSRVPLPVLQVSEASQDIIRPTTHPATNQVTRGKHRASGPIEKEPRNPHLKPIRTGKTLTPEFLRRLKEAADAHRAKVGVEFPKLYPPTKGHPRTDNQPRLSVRNNKFSVTVADLLFWAKHFDGVAFVAISLERYPTVSFPLKHPAVDSMLLPPSKHMHCRLLPSRAVTKIVGAIEAKRFKDTGSPHSTDIVDFDSTSTERVQMYVTRIRGEEEVYTEAYLQVATEIHRCRNTTDEWTLDWNWLVASEWKRSRLAEAMIRSNIGTTTEIVKHTVKLFSQCHLRREFSVPVPANKSVHTLHFEDLISRVARKKWLSGSVILHAMYVSFLDREDAYVIDEATVNTRSNKFPEADIKTFSYIVQPHSIDNNHWVVMIVHLNFSTGSITPTFYDPLCTDENIEILLATWQSFTLPHIQVWPKRDNPDEELTIRPSHTYDRPLQQDTYNCGVFCVSMVDSIVHGHFELLQANTLPQHDLSALRLRILCDIMVSSDPPKDKEEVVTMRRSRWQESLSRSRLSSASR